MHEPGAKRAIDDFDRDIIQYVLAWAQYGGLPCDEILPRFGFFDYELCERMRVIALRGLRQCPAACEGIFARRAIATGDAMEKERGGIPNIQRLGQEEPARAGPRSVQLPPTRRPSGVEPPAGRSARFHHRSPPKFLARLADDSWTHRPTRRRRGDRTARPGTDRRELVLATARQLPRYAISPLLLPRRGARSTAAPPRAASQADMSGLSGYQRVPRTRHEMARGSWRVGCHDTSRAPSMARRGRVTVAPVPIPSGQRRRLSYHFGFTDLQWSHQGGHPSLRRDPPRRQRTLRRN
jgi:hypothetical protein